MYQVIRYLGSEPRWFTGTFMDDTWTDNPANAKLYDYDNNPYADIDAITKVTRIPWGCMVLQTTDQAERTLAAHLENPTNWVEVTHNGKTAYIDPKDFKQMVERSYGFERLGVLYDLFPEVFDTLPGVPS